MNNIILASKSPRRIELLKLITPHFDVIPSNFDESTIEKTAPEEYTKTLAFHKANTVFTHYPKSTVIGCDTVVVSHCGDILGIPKDYDTAYNYISTLSGKRHHVITGVNILSEDRMLSFYETTDVFFYPLSDKTIIEYLQKDEWQDKAGGYGIQGYGSLLVDKINGDYYNVVGLPISKINQALYS